MVRLRPGAAQGGPRVWDYASTGTGARARSWRRARPMTSSAAVVITPEITIADNGRSFTNEAAALRIVPTGAR